MTELWEPVRGFPDYSISTEGRVRNDNRGRLVRLSITQAGVVKVGLMSDGRRYTKSVKVLVAEVFVKGRTQIYNTAIVLDGDQTNLFVDNLMWRPRWFAWKYTRQFDEIDYYRPLGAIVDRNTGLVYTGVVDASIKNGLLFREVHMSLVNKVPVFPTFHMFDFVKT